MRDSNSYIRTFSGKQFWPLDPRPEDVDIHDIAHALAYKCRYGGHANRHYSVAEHSVRMARVASEANKFAALMHDAGEAYLPDVARPVKKILPGFLEVEARVDRAIAEALRVRYPWPAEVHQLDAAILTDEMRTLLPYGDWDGARWGAEDGRTEPIVWRYGAAPLFSMALADTFGWNQKAAEAAFLDMYDQLKPGATYA